MPNCLSDDSVLNLDRDFLSRIATNDVRNVDLTSANLPFRGLEVLTYAIERSTSVLLLNLGGNGVGKNSLAVKAVAKCLRHNTSLVTVDLCDNELDDAAVATIAEALRENSQLNSLFLPFNKFGLAATEAIASVMPQMHSLQMLDLSHNGVGDDGAVLIAKAARECPGMTVLHLTNCLVKDNGAVELARTMILRRSFKRLYLNDNPIGDVGVRELLKVGDANPKQMIYLMSGVGTGHEMKEVDLEAKREAGKAALARISSNQSRPVSQGSYGLRGSSRGSLDTWGDESWAGTASPRHPHGRMSPRKLVGSPGSQAESWAGH